MIEARTQTHVHEAARGRLKKGVLCNVGTFQKFPLAREKSFAAQTQTDENQNVINFYTFAPIVPPQLTKPLQEYKRNIKTAPYRALLPRAKNFNEIPQKVTIGWKNRIRSQVGQTNRWRLSTWMGTDMLGTSQAVRAMLEAPSDGIITRNDPNDQMGQNEFSDKMDEAASIAASEEMAGSLPADEDSPELPEINQNPTEPELVFDVEKPTSADTRGSTLPPLNNEPSSITSRGGRRIKSLTDVQIEPRPITVRAFTPFHKIEVDLSEPDFYLSFMGYDFELNFGILSRSKRLLRIVQERGRTPSLGEKRSLSKRQTMLLAHGQSREVIRVSALNETDSRSVIALSRDVTAIDFEVLPKFQLQIPENLKYPVTVDGVCICLANMYLETMSVTPEEAPEVYAAAKFLEFRELKYRTLDVMVCGLSPERVGAYCDLAEKHNIPLLSKACIRWLSFHFVTEMIDRIELGQLSLKTLLAVLCNKNLYVNHEFSLYKALCTWIYLKTNNVKQMPTFSTVVTYFNSLPKWISFLGRDETASQYMPLFSQLRLHALTDPTHLEFLQKMNVMPQNWILNLVTMNYRSLQVGGDMSLVMAFETSAARYGLNIVENTRVVEVMSLHGFYFEISATPYNFDSANFVPSQPLSFFLQIRRLKPNDPVLSLGSKEKYTFSMRQDRELMYSLGAQWFEESTEQFYAVQSPIRRQRFAFSSKMSKSETYEVRPGGLPLRVTVALLFPPS